MTSLCFLTVMPSPYQRELFRALGGSAGMDVTVYYYVEKPADRNWEKVKYEDYEFLLPGRTLSWLWDSAHWNPGILSKLRNTKSDLVVISDYSSLTAQIAMWYLTLTGRRWVYWGERPGMRRGLVRGWLRSLLMLPIRHGAAAVCAIGSRAEKHYRRWLREKKQVFNIPYFCDLHPFQSITKEKHQRTNLLFSGQFIARKGIDILLQAFDAIADEYPDVDLILAGGSEGKINLEHATVKYKDRIRFAGFVQTEKLSNLFAQADIFILPSRYDGWGVVINEALGAGLPVIASDQVGAAHDLIVHGENGYIFPSEDVQKLAEYLRLLAESSELRRKFSEASRQRSTLFGLDEGVRRWKKVCEMILAGAG